MPPAPQELPVWRLRLDWPDDVIAALSENLAPDELERAHRFKFKRDRHRYVAARGQLRQILGRRVGRPARELRFAYGSYGKPSLADNADGIEFNLAHSADLAVLAITPGSAVGIDLEYQQRRFDLDGIARRFFAPGEVARLEALPPAARPAAFFRCWTRKEAYLKAHGAGLSVALDSFEVTFAAGEPPRLLWTADGTERNWTLLELSVPAGFAAAAAVAASGRGVIVVDRGEWPVDGH
jgi:4'-phosphopantetheinyl transferase